MLDALGVTEFCILIKFKGLWLVWLWMAEIRLVLSIDSCSVDFMNLKSEGLQVWLNLSLLKMSISKNFVTGFLNLFNFSGI